MKSTVSIIIPTFNSSNTLSSCLESIYKQTYKFVEVIIVDGLSTDNTLEIANTYTNSFSSIKIFSEKDGGIYDAMNKGILKAKGDWLYFLGSDDILYDESVIFNFAKATQTSNSKFFYGDVSINGNGFAFGGNGSFYGGEFDIKKMFNQNICHQSIFYHRSIFNEIGLYNLKYKYYADWDFNLKCFFKTKPVYLNFPIAYYSVSGTSSGQIDKLFIADIFDNVAKLSHYLLYLNHFKEQKEKVRKLALKCLDESKIFKSIFFLYCYSIHTGQFINDFIKPIIGWVITKIKVK